MTGKNEQLASRTTQDQSASPDCANEDIGLAETLDFDNNAHLFAQLAKELAAAKADPSTQVG